MPRPPVRLLVAVLLVAAAALVALAGTSIAVPIHMQLMSWIVAGELGIAIVAGRLGQVSLTRRTQQSVTTAPLLLATVLLPAPVAMVGVGLIWIVTEAVQRVTWSDTGRVPWFQNTFNAAQQLLRVAAGAAIFRAVAGTAVLGGTVTPRLLLAVALAGVALIATNKVLLFTIVSVQEGKWQRAGLWRLVRVNLPQEGSLVLLGILGAMVAGPAPVAAAMPLVATVIIQRELVELAGRPRVDLVADEEQPSAVTEAALTPVPPVAALWFGAA